MAMPTSTIKAWSHYGFIRKGGRQHDPGNKLYTAWVLLMIDGGAPLGVSCAGLSEGFRFKVWALRHKGLLTSRFYIVIG